MEFLSEIDIAEECELMAQLLSSCSFPNQSLHEESLSFNSEMLLQPSYNSEMAMDFCFGDSKNGCSNHDTSDRNADRSGDEICIILSENPRKRIQKSLNVSKERNVRSRKNQKLVSHITNYENAQISSTISENDSFALKSNEKIKASKGSATDPQSLYARKRRERINKRLRVLQNLVPNGTKVDISTMLDEAVQYVKFLQHQIMLLSSDDMWMYAPIAYNGINLGLNT